MITDINSEDRLVQQTFAEHLEQISKREWGRNFALLRATRKRAVVRFREGVLLQTR